MKTQSRLKGIAMSYGVTVLRSVSQLLLTSLYIKKLGLEGYGFYQYIYSIASCAIILDFGISSVVNKYYVEYKEKNQKKSIENALFYCLLISLLAVLLIIAFGTIVFFQADRIFGDLSAEKSALARQLLVFIVLYLSTLMIQHFFEGVILAQEKYVTLKTIALVQVLLKTFFVVALLFGNFGVVSIALSDFLSTFLCLAFSAFYSFVGLKIKVKYHFFDKALIFDAVKLAGALCIQSVILYLNTSIDKFVVGRMIGDVAVSLYSIALTISSFFDEIPTVIQRLYLPQAVKLVTNEADGKILTDFIIRPGRYQFILCGGLFGAFLLFGKEFIYLWSGIKNFEPWIIAILLMGASIVPLCQNVGLAILTALNKRMFRSVCLGVAAGLNLILTVFLVSQWGLLGAPIGTFISLIICNNILMNIYYKKIGIDIKRLFACIFKGILPSVLLTIIMSLPLLLIKTPSYAGFMIKCLVFVLMYACVLWLVGLNSEEKKTIKMLSTFKQKLLK